MNASGRWLGLGLVLCSLLGGTSLGSMAAPSSKPPRGADPGQAQSTLAQKLHARQWRLEGTRASSLDFRAAGQAGGYGGCNWWIGSYRLEGDRLTFGGIAATKRACMGDAMVQEDAFLRELAGTHRVEFAGETLRLEHTTTQRVLTFVPDVQPRTNPRQ